MKTVYCSMICLLSEQCPGELRSQTRGSSGRSLAFENHDLSCLGYINRVEQFGC